MKKLFPFLLFAVSLIVDLGLIIRQDMWPWIVMYWLVLMLKNLNDLLEV